jgi:hypothetical protein
MQLMKRGDNERKKRLNPYQQKNSGMRSSAMMTYKQIKFVVVDKEMKT